MYSRNRGLFNAALFVAFVSLLVNQYSPIDPQYVDNLPDVPLKVNYDLSEAEHLFEGEVIQPEHIVKSKNGLLYTGLMDGRIVLFDEEAKTWKLFARVGKDLPSCGEPSSSNECGHPLGLTFASAKFFKHYLKHKISEDEEVLLVADAFQGLLLIDQKGNVQVLLNEVNGEKVIFADFVVVSNDGIVYMSELSTKYGFHELILDFLERKDSGRVISFDPKNKKVTVLLKDYPMANGLALADDDKSLLVCSSTTLTINKLYLKGSKKGQLEKFTEFPGSPDNLVRQYVEQWNKEVYIVGLVSKFSTIDRIVLKLPALRKFLACFPDSLVKKIVEPYGMIAIVDMDGKILHILQDPTGRTGFTTGGYVAGKYLYIGSFKNPFLARIPLPKLESIV